MRIRAAAFVGIVGIASVVGLPSRAAAQDAPALEIAGGYQFMRDYAPDRNRPGGWFVSGAGRLTDKIHIVGEVAGSHTTDSNDGDPMTLFPEARADVDVLTFLGGVRVRLGSGRVIPFGQVMLGAGRVSSRVSGFFPQGDVTTSETAFTIQPGFGVDVPFGNNVAARAVFDYRRLSTKGGATNQTRVAAGIVVGFGSR